MKGKLKYTGLWLMFSIVSMVTYGQEYQTMIVNIDAQDIAYWKSADRLLVCTVAGVKNGNSLLVINPYTGSIESSYDIGSNPNTLTISPDEKYAYVGLSGANRVVRFDLANMKLDLQIPLGYSVFSAEAYSPKDLAVPPNSTKSFVVSRTENDVSSSSNGVMIFDDAVQRYSTDNSLITSRVLYTDKNELYANVFSKLTRLDTTGLTLTVGDVYTFEGSIWSEMSQANNYIYSKNGFKIDAIGEPILEHQFKINCGVQGKPEFCAPLGDTVFMIGGGLDRCLVGALNSPPYTELFTVPLSDRIDFILGFTTWGVSGVAFLTRQSNVEPSKLVIMRPCLYDSDIVPTLVVDGIAGACYGQSYILNADTSFASFYWSNGEVTPSITTNRAGDFSYQIADSAGCLSASSNEVSVAFGFMPDAPVITQEYDTVSICQGEKVSLAVPFSSNTFYFWSNGEETQRIEVDTAGTYIIRFVSKTGCVQPIQDTITILQKPFPIPAKPELSHSGFEVLCVGDSVMVEGPVGLSQYFWYVGNEVYPTLENSYTVVGLTTGATLVALQTVDENSCKSDISDEFTLIFRAKPLPPIIERNGFDLRVIDAGTFQWYLNGDEIPDATSNTWSPTVAGFYQVRKILGNCASELSIPYNYE